MPTSNSVNTPLSGSSGTGSFAGTTSPTLTTPVLGAASATSLTFSSTTGLVGTTTNDNAAGGSVGEFMSSSVVNTTVSLSTGAVANVTSLTLTAGDWDCFGNLSFTGNVATTTVYTQGALSTTSTTLPAAQFFTGQFYSAAGSLVYGTATSSFCVPNLRVTVANGNTTTLYLCAQSGFGVSTTTVGGSVYARRRR